MLRDLLSNKKQRYGSYGCYMSGAMVARSFRTRAYSTIKIAIYLSGHKRPTRVFSALQTISDCNGNRYQSLLNIRCSSRHNLLRELQTGYVVPLIPQPFLWRYNKHSFSGLRRTYLKDFYNVTGLTKCFYYYGISSIESRAELIVVRITAELCKN